MLHNTSKLDFVKLLLSFTLTRAFKVLKIVLGAIKIQMYTAYAYFLVENIHTVSVVPSFQVTVY